MKNIIIVEQISESDAINILNEAIKEENITENNANNTTDFIVTYLQSKGYIIAKIQSYK